MLRLNLFNRTKPLLHLLRVEQCSQLYLKHKLFFMKQINLNSLSLDVFRFTHDYYEWITPPKSSFVYQLGQVSDITGLEATMGNFKQSIILIDNNFSCNDQDINEAFKICIYNYKYFKTVTMGGFLN